MGKREADELIRQAEKGERISFKVSFNPKKKKDYEFLCKVLGYMQSTGENFREAVMDMTEISKTRKESINNSALLKGKKNTSSVTEAGKSRSENTVGMADTYSSDEKKKILKEKLKQMHGS